VWGGARVCLANEGNSLTCRHTFVLGAAAGDDNFINDGVNTKSECDGVNLDMLTLR
jgi:hypothetical protein